MRRVLPLVALLILGGAAPAHEVLDPVCRMRIDNDTTRFRTRYGGETFWFCSGSCQERFAAEPEGYALLWLRLLAESRTRYAASLEPPAGPFRAGEPAALVLVIRDGAKGAPLERYEVVHEKELHLLVVPADLSVLLHEHPERGPDGRWRIELTFPRPGPWSLYLDFTPPDAMNVVRRIDLEVSAGAGGPGPTEPALPRIACEVLPDRIRAGKDAYLVYRFADAEGRPVDDLEPFLGASGHLIACRAGDPDVFLHTHALTAAPPPGHTIYDLPAALVTERGPAVSFKPVFPEPGRYAVWAQFAWRGAVRTHRLEVEVLP